MTNRPWFEQRLRRFSQVRRHLLNATLAYRLGSAVLVIGALSLLILSGWLPGAIVNLALFGLAALVVVGLLVSYPIWHVRFRSPLDEAFRIEALVGDLHSRVISAWDFVTRDFTHPLAMVVVEKAHVDLQAPVEERLDRSQRNTRRRQFAAALIAFVALGMTPWFGFGRVADNLRRSWAEAMDRLFPVRYVVEPGGPRHIRRLGETLELVVRFEKRHFEQITLSRRQADESTTETVVPVDEDGIARYSLTSPVETTYAVQFAFGSRQTESIECIFTTAPSLVNMQTEIVPPSYTGQLPRSLEGVQQRLLGLPGTRMTLGFTFSKELESGLITWDDGQKLPLETVGRFASVGLVHQQARQARLQVRDVHGLELDDPVLIDFDLQVDEKPQLFVPKHLKEDLPLLGPEVASFGFGIRAQDDYGVTRCILKWQKSTVDSPATIVDQGEVERLVSPSQRNVVVNFEKTFEGLTVKPGDKVAFDVEVTDNRAPQKQTTKSRRFSFFVYDQDLGKLSIAQLGFGSSKDLVEGRLGKSQKATAVKSPEGLRNRELVKNEFDAEVKTSTQAPTVRGEFGRAAQDYFRVLSGAKYEDAKKKSPAATKPNQGEP